MAAGLDAVFFVNRAVQAGRPVIRGRESPFPYDRFRMCRDRSRDRQLRHPGRAASENGTDPSGGAINLSGRHAGRWISAVCSRRGGDRFFVSGPRSPRNRLASAALPPCNGLRRAGRRPVGDHLSHEGLHVRRVGGAGPIWGHFRRKPPYPVNPPKPVSRLRREGSALRGFSGGHRYGA